MTQETTPDWIAQTREFLELTREAREFVERAAETFPKAIVEDAQAVARLWQHAAALDPQVYPLLEEINQHLLEGKGEVDMTRGASVRSILPGVVQEELLFYECTWTLNWEEANHQIFVKLAVEPQMESFHLQVSSFNTLRPVDVRLPVEVEQFKEALKKVYVQEVLP